MDNFSPDLGYLWHDYKYLAWKNSISLRKKIHGFGGARTHDYSGSDKIWPKCYNHLATHTTEVWGFEPENRSICT